MRRMGKGINFAHFLCKKSILTRNLNKKTFSQKNELGEFSQVVAFYRFLWYACLVG